jgi:hypothetical protein
MGVSLPKKDISNIGMRTDMAFTMASFAALTGPPIAGVMIDPEGGYDGTRAFAGTAMGDGGWVHSCGNEEKDEQYRDGGRRSRFETANV